MKVMWLCHFANKELQERFPVNKVDEFAPWIPALRDSMLKHTNIELHIVAPNVYSNKDKELQINGVHYYFYKHHFLLPRRYYNNLLIDFLSGFWLIKRKVLRMADTIQPDIIHVHGTENEYYSAATLALRDKYKVLVSIQGLRTKTPSQALRTRLRKQVEMRILRNCEHYGVQTLVMKEYIRRFNPQARFHWHDYPYPISDVVSITPIDSERKVYDIVFFARVVKTKGIEDLLSALAAVKMEFENVSLLICGQVQSEYKLYLEKLAGRLNVAKNMLYAGFLDRGELHKSVSEARISVLPTHYDNLPGTVLESMYLGLPVVAYDVDGMSELNKDRESVLLVPKGDIQALASAILKLLKDKSLYTQYQKNAQVSVEKFFNRELIAHIVHQAYASIISES